MSEFVDAAWSMMVTVDDFAEVVLSGVPRKSEPHRLLLPPPQTQRRPHGTGLEPAGPTARPSGEAETAVVAWTPRGLHPHVEMPYCCMSDCPAILFAPLWCGSFSEIQGRFTGRF